MVADIVLRFVAEAVAQREVRAKLEVVLEEDACIEVVDGGRADSGSDVVLSRGVGFVGVKRRIDVLAVEACVLSSCCPA